MIDLFMKRCDVGGFIYHLAYQNFDGSIRWASHTSPECTNVITHKFKPVCEDQSKAPWSYRCEKHVKILDERCLIESLDTPSDNMLD